jgi:MoaA/NifB/PqqE/SkfB family radical SAM enzyme
MKQLVEKEDINSFFCDIKHLLSDEPTKSVESVPSNELLVKTVNDKEGSTRTNIVYLNTDCNLRCEYCYEKDSREGLPDQANCTTDQIDSFINEINKREKGRNSCIVVMGGEPLLRFDLLEYLIRKTMSIEKPEGWAIPVTTNGMMFLSKRLIKKYVTLMKDIEACEHVVHDIEISFDVSGQFRRKMPDGSNSRPYVEQGIRNVIDAKLPLRLSYTVHIGNYENIVKDLVYLLETYPSVQRISLSWAQQELDDKLGVDGYSNLKKKIRPYAKHLFERYNTPICDLACSICNLCDRSSSVGNAYLSPTEGIMYANKRTEKGFTQF